MFTSVSAVVKEHTDCGARCLLCIGSVVCVIQIFAQLTSKSFPNPDIELSGKIVAELKELNGLTALYAKGFRV